MAFHVRDDKTDALVRELARKRGVSLTEAIRDAVAGELERDRLDLEAREKQLDAILAEIDSWPRTGLKADKAFFDEISGD